MGLYFHIPFCDAVCHYCDFAKTANFSSSHTEVFFRSLRFQWTQWRQVLESHNGQPLRWSSLFFGGGTPSLFTEEYRPLMTEVTRQLLPQAEVTIEANPEMVTPDKCQHWLDLGFNRISLGVQTFSKQGLPLLTRTHSAANAQRAIGIALDHFGKVNIDLIFGWPNQTIAQWRDDLEMAAATGVGHVSTYELTYEGNTVFHKRAKRGVYQPLDERAYMEFHEQTEAALTGAGFRHEEVSNWSKPRQTCEHNWSYWQAKPYLGIGPGAHSHLYSRNKTIGERFAYDRQLARFTGKFDPAETLTIGDWQAPVVLDRDRDGRSWLAESLAVGLRTVRGVDWNRCLAVCGPKVQTLVEDLPTELTLEQGVLRLAEPEWLRVDSWVRWLLDRAQIP
mgnify:CR=1 FL=1